MKARVATIISIGGVLFAGTAAALVNTEVLGGRDASGVATVPVSTPATISTTPTTGSAPPSATAPTNGSTPTTGVTVATESTPTTPGAPTSPTTGPAVTAGSTPTTGSMPSAAPDPTAPPTAGRSTYQAGVAGTVTLAASGGGLTVAGASPAPGWVVERQEQEGAASIEVRFESDGGEVRFEASLVRGVIVTAVDERTDDSGSGTGFDGHDGRDGSGSSGPDGSSGSSSGSGSGGDDDHDDSSGHGSDD